MHLHTDSPKSKLLYRIKKYNMPYNMVLKHASEIIFFVKLKCQWSTIILSVDIKYSMNDPVCEVSYCS